MRWPQTDQESKGSPDVQRIGFNDFTYECLWVMGLLTLGFKIKVEPA